MPDPGSPFYVAFDDDTLEASPTFTQITQARTFELARGRSSELDKTGTGTCRIGTVDLVGALDPTNPTGPAYGKLDPMKQARVAIVNPYKLLNDADSTLYSLLRGYVETWGPFEVAQDGGRIEGEVQLVDALELFAQLRMMPGHGDPPPDPDAGGDVYFLGGPNGYSSGGYKHVDQRLVQILDLIGWPGTGAYQDGQLRDVFSGNVQLLEQVYARADQALNAIDDAVDSELPFVATRFMSKDGAFTFRGRFPRFFPGTPSYNVNEWSLGGRPQAELDPSSIVLISRLPAFQRSALDVINAALSIPSGADDSDVPGNLVTDATSIGKFGYRSRDTQNLLTYRGHTDMTHTNAIDETRKFAEYRVSNYKTPRTRVGQVEIIARDPRDPFAQAQWDFLTRVELSDLVHLETTHPGGGGFDEDYFVDGIHMVAAPAPPPKFYELTCTLDLTPRSLYADGSMFGDVDGGVT